MKHHLQLDYDTVKAKDVTKYVDTCFPDVSSSSPTSRNLEILAAFLDDEGSTTWSSLHMAVIHRFLHECWSTLSHDPLYFTDENFTFSDLTRSAFLTAISTLHNLPAFPVLHDHTFSDSGIRILRLYLDRRLTPSFVPKGITWHHGHARPSSILGLYNPDEDSSSDTDEEQAASPPIPCLSTPPSSSTFPVSHRFSLDSEVPSLLSEDRAELFELNHPSLEKPRDGGQPVFQNESLPSAVHAGSVDHHNVTDLDSNDFFTPTPSTATTLTLPMDGNDSPSGADNCSHSTSAPAPRARDVAPPLDVYTSDGSSNEATATSPSHKTLHGTYDSDELVEDALESTVSKEKARPKKLRAKRSFGPPSKRLCRRHSSLDDEARSIQYSSSTSCKRDDVNMTSDSDRSEIVLPIPKSDTVYGVPVTMLECGMRNILDLLNDDDLFLQRFKKYPVILFLDLEYTGEGKCQFYLSCHGLPSSSLPLYLLLPNHYASLILDIFFLSLPLHCHTLYRLLLP